MYLKSIEMQGFKSFANKMVLEFHDGITGIVGPNGSGKSNVADAVRWVLGEQSARQLRGGNMQDVIFAGTENRKPLGFASVAITLDNTDHQLAVDYEEVTVTRRLYRSGESEYLMNGAPCRLKDIHELFYDTGIGKEGYSIIGQGQIDKILSGKPEDRRELFDEAAGIVKFKRRKNATLKKLDEEQQNLVRISDILSELTRQIGPLEKQSEKARIYLDRRETLKQLEIGQFRVESEYLENEKKGLLEKQLIANEQLQAITENLETTRLEYDRLEDEISTLDERIAASREAASGSELKKEQLEGRINVLKEQIRGVGASREQSEKRKMAIRESVSQKEEVRLQNQKMLEEIAYRLQETSEKQKQAEKKVDHLEAQIAEYNAMIEQGRGSLITVLNSRSTIKGKLQRYETMLEQIQIRKSELSRRYIQLKQDSSEFESVRGKLEKELTEIDNKLLEKEEEEKQTQSEILARKKGLEETNNDLENAQGRYHRNASRLESLKNMAERYEGYGNSIRKVMEQKKNNPGIHGVVADLIQTDEAYETAIETALGGSLQNIVTDNESTAKYLIEYLKRGHFGRATFLPLTGMRQDKDVLGGQLLKEEGAIGKASELVRCAEEYRILVDRLLGRTLVVDHIDHAIRIARKYRQSVRMVTLEGELLNPGGSMTGGSFRNNSNLLGRKREIEDLEKQVRRDGREMENLRGRIESLKQERTDLRAHLQDIQDEIQNLTLDQTAAKLNLDTAQTRSQELDETRRDLNREGLEIDQQAEEIRANMKEISGELEESQNAEKTLETEVQSAGDQLIGIQEAHRKALGEKEQIMLSFSELSQQCGFLKSTGDTLDKDIRGLEDEMRDIDLQLQTDSEGARVAEQEIVENNLALEELKKCIDEKHLESENLKKEKEELNLSHRAFFEKRDALSDQKTLLDKECFRLQGTIDRTDEKLEGLVSHLWEEYQITPDKTEQYQFEEIPSRKQLQEQIRSLKSEIKDLGNVNVNAIEEYKEVKERHTFLSAQYEDITKAADTLNGIIEELDQGMRKQFTAKFAEIKEEFDKAFKQLFGGGKGTLELVEDEDVLEAGIRIISQPPGKKLQNMMQLSGGEKALTAIALLFAIQNLKPSPFCLLDEIEAALDDSNIVRFSGYLHKLTKNTQFIIITHRRGTMTAADRLYGITMQEKGVSALVSVNLIEAQLDQ